MPSFHRIQHATLPSAGKNWLFALCWLAISAQAMAAALDLQPKSDSQVIETLAPRTNNAVSAASTVAAKDPQAVVSQAAQAARQWINQTRQSGDPRYLGRAQGVLAPWWDKADAPPELAILQATVQQSRHEFDAARITLAAALARDPSQSQGWLTLATLERLAGRYAAASAACERIAQPQAALYRQACLLETRSLQGQQSQARDAWLLAIGQSKDAALQSWLLSLLAESEERAGRTDAAIGYYKQSLARAPDGYTALALADALLRTGKPAAAIEVLAQQNATDAVLLRRAYAYKLIGDARWKSLLRDLQERFAELNARGDDPALHARESAQAALWLEGDAAKALQAAELNLTLQKEPLDWALALQSAAAAKQSAKLAALRQQLAATGLKDVRLLSDQTTQ
jgi:tetratricopeptide (TPR) repeat protein